MDRQKGRNTNWMCRWTNTKSHLSFRNQSRLKSHIAFYVLFKQWDIAKKWNTNRKHPVSWIRNSNHFQGFTSNLAVCQLYFLCVVLNFSRSL